MNTIGTPITFEDNTSPYLLSLLPDIALSYIINGNVLKWIEAFGYTVISHFIMFLLEPWYVERTSETVRDEAEAILNRRVLEETDPQSLDVNISFLYCFHIPTFFFFISCFYSRDVSAKLTKLDGCAKC